MTDVKKLFSDFKKELQNHQSKLLELKRERGEKQNEIDRLLALPISKSDFALLLKKSIKIQGDLFTKNMANDMLYDGFGNTKFSDRSLSYFNVSLGMVGHNSMEHSTWIVGATRNKGIFHDLGDNETAVKTLCWLMPEVVYERIMALVNDDIGDQWGNDDLPSIEERMSTINTLEDEIQTLDSQISELSEALIGIE